LPSQTTQIITYFTRKDWPSGVFQFEDILAEAVESALSLPGIDRDRYTEANIDRHWNDVKKLLERDPKKGLCPLFLIKDEYSKRVSSFLEEETSLIPTKKRLLLKGRSAFLRKIDGFSYRKYEALGCLVSNLLGADNILLTPPKNEAGIDFIATIEFGHNAHYLFGINGPLRLIGQCKKYATPVQVDSIKEFNSTLQDVYHLTQKVVRFIPAWFSTAKGPIIGWFISHSGFQKGAIDRAKNFGIVLSDSRDLAEIIAGSRKFYSLEPIDKRLLHLNEKIASILQSREI